MTKEMPTASAFLDSPNYALWLGYLRTGSIALQLFARTSFRRFRRMR